MDKQNYRVGSTPIRHNGRFFGAGEPVALTDDEAKALPAGAVSLDPMQAQPPAHPGPAEPAAQAPAAEPASATAAPETTTEPPVTAAKGKAAKSGDKA